MTSQKQIQRQVNQEFIAEVVGWDPKHVGRYLRYGHVLNNLVVPPALQQPVKFALEGIEDAFRNNDREGGRVRERVLKELLLASHVAGVTPENSHRMLTPEALERMLESLTQAALKHRIGDKVRLAAAACFAKKGEIASVEEMAAAELIAAMPLHVIRTVQDFLTEVLGPDPFDEWPEPIPGAAYPFPETQLRRVCNQFAERHWMVQREWMIVGGFEGETRRGWLFEIREGLKLGVSAGPTALQKQIQQGEFSNLVWPTIEGLIFHRTISLEQQMIEQELKFAADNAGA